MPSDWEQKYERGTLLFSPTLPPTGLNATIGNGYLATAVGSDTMYISGVYNGIGAISPSHRARIPGFLALSFSGVEEDVVGYALDLEKGAFYKRSILSGSVPVEMVSYAHRTRRGLLVVELTSSSRVEVSVNISVNSGSTIGGDFGLSPDNETTLLVFETLQAEDPRFCSTTRVACYFRSFVRPTVTLSAQNNFTLRFVASFATSLDSIDVVGESVANYRSAMSNVNLFQEHVAAWEKLSPTSKIDVNTTDLTLRQTIFSSLYYILSSIRDDWPYSLSPGGLASNGYNGHVFWDCETWMAPTLMLFYPEIAQSIVQYRTDRVPGYVAKAKSYPYEGLCVSWESAQTGVECCPVSCHCGPCEREIHINGDVALSMWQFYSLHGASSEWLQTSYEFLKQMADFWVSRSTLNQDGSYSINDVLPPDEYHDHVNDSVFTNVGASFALNLTVAWGKLCGDKSANFTAYQQVASRLRIPVNESLGIHKEYESYAGETIKQADTILIAFPFGYKSPLQLNDLNYYTNRTDVNNGPAMTWGLTAINYLDFGIKFQDMAQKFFSRSYLPYIRPPFFIWFETPTGGTSNFITGAGGFLQGIPFGFAGIRFHSDHLSLNNFPLLPGNATSFDLNGVSYQSFNLFFHFDAATVTIKSDKVTSLTLVHGQTKASITTQPLTLARDGQHIQIWHV